MTTYKYIKGLDYKILFLDSISEFDSLMKEKTFGNRDIQSHYQTVETTTTSSFQEAEELRRLGDKNSYKNIVSVLNKFDSKNHNNEWRHSFRNDVVGHVPHVPNSLAGSPVDMIQTTYYKKPNAQVKLVVDVAFNKNHTPENMSTYGATIMSIIDQLESEGIRVELYLSFTYGSYSPVTEEKILTKKRFYSFEKQLQITNHNFKALFNKRLQPKKRYELQQVVKQIHYEDTLKLKDDKRFVHGMILKVKNYSEPLNAYLLSYYLVNPSFLRRQCLRLLEVVPGFFDDTQGMFGYGVSNNKVFDKASRIVMQQFKDENVSYFNNALHPFTNASEITKYVDEAVKHIKFNIGEDVVN